MPRHEVQLGLLFSEKQRLDSLSSQPADLQFDRQPDPKAKHKLRVILTETMPEYMERNRDKYSQIKKANIKTRKTSKVQRIASLGNTSYKMACLQIILWTFMEGGFMVIHLPFPVAFTNEAPRKKTYVCSRATI